MTPAPTILMSTGCCQSIGIGNKPENITKVKWDEQARKTGGGIKVYGKAQVWFNMIACEEKWCGHWDSSF